MSRPNYLYCSCTREDVKRYCEQPGHTRDSRTDEPHRYRGLGFLKQKRSISIQDIYMSACGWGSAYCSPQYELIRRGVKSTKFAIAGAKRKNEILLKFVTHDSKLWPRNFLWQPFETLRHPNTRQTHEPHEPISKPTAHPDSNCPTTIARLTRQKPVNITTSHLTPAARGHLVL